MGSCRKEPAIQHEDTLAYLRNLSEGEACLPFADVPQPQLCQPMGRRRSIGNP